MSFNSAANTNWFGALKTSDAVEMKTSRSPFGGLNFV